MTVKRRARKNERETLLGLGNVSSYPVNPGVGSSNEWFLHQSDPRVVEDSGPVMLVGRNNVDRIHVVGSAAPLGNG